MLQVSSEVRMSVVPGSAVFDRLMSHTSTESNTDSPPLEYMPGGSREQQLFQFDQNMLLSNWLRDDSQSVAATSVRIGENLSMVDFHDNYSYHDEFTHTQNGKWRIYFVSITFFHDTNDNYMNILHC